VVIVSSKSNCDLGAQDGGDGFTMAFDCTSEQNAVLCGSAFEGTRTSEDPLGKPSEVVRLTMTCGAAAIVIGGEIFAICFCPDNLVSDGMDRTDEFKSWDMEPVKRSSGTLGGGAQTVDATVEQAAPMPDSATEEAGGDIPFGLRFSGKQEESKLFRDNVTDTPDLKIAAGELCSSLSILDEAPNSG